MYQHFLIVPNSSTLILFYIHFYSARSLVRNERSGTKKTEYARQDDSSFYYLRLGKNAAVTLI